LECHPRVSGEFDAEYVQLRNRRFIGKPDVKIDDYLEGRTRALAPGVDNPAASPEAEHTQGKYSICPKMAISGDD
jgi:hypothetical protein